jgi:uncharacterized protein (DUF2345 family)
VQLTVDSGTLTEFAKGQISIESPAGIVLKCGASTITLTPSSILIHSTTVDVKGPQMVTINC